MNFIAKSPTGQKQTKFRLTAGTDTFFRAEVDHGGIIDEEGKLTYRVNGYYHDSEDIRGGELMPTEKYGIGPSFIWRISDNTKLDVNAALSVSSCGACSSSLRWCPADMSALFHHRTPGNVASAHWMIPATWEMYEKAGIVDSSTWNPKDFPLLPVERVFGFPEAWRDVDVTELDIALTHRFNDIMSFRQGFRLDTYEEEFRRHSTPPRVSIDPTDPSKRRVSDTYRQEFHSDDGFRSQGDLLFDFEVAKTDHQVLLGYEYYDQSGDDRTGQRGGLFQDMYNPSYVFPAGFDPDTYITTFTTDLSTIGDGFAYYAQYSGSFFEDRINAIYGWRKDRTSRSTHNNRNNTDTNPGDQTTDVPRYSVSFKPVPQVSLYYLYSEQADPSSTINRYGNWQAIGGATLPPDTDPRYNELITSAVTASLNEYGVKADFFNQRLFLSVAYFEMVREGNFTNAIGTELGANGIGTVQFNDFFIGTGELIDGIEIEAFGQPTDKLTFYAALALPNGSKPRANGSRGGIEALGDTFTLHGKYSFRDDNGNGFEVNAGGKVWFSGWTMIETVDFEFPDNQYSIDLGGSYYWDSGKHGVHLKVNNVTDEFVYLTANSQWGLMRAYVSFTTAF